MFAKILKFINSAMSWCGFKPSSTASCFTMIGGLIWMTFCEVASAAASGSATASSVSGGGGGAGASFLGGGAVGASNEARIREIGGRTVAFFFISPSAALFFGWFLSINQTLSTAGPLLALCLGLALSSAT